MQTVLLTACEVIFFYVRELRSGSCLNHANISEVQEVLTAPQVLLTGLSLGLTSAGTGG